MNKREEDYIKTIYTCLLYTSGILFKVIKDKYHKHQIIKYHILIHAYHHGNLVTELNNIDMMINNGYISKEKDKYLLTQKGVCKVEAIIGEENGC